MAHKIKAFYPPALELVPVILYTLSIFLAYTKIPIPYTKVSFLDSAVLTSKATEHKLQIDL
jgi:hypothetical protein